MPLDCPSLTNDFLPALVGEFAEVRAPSKENLGIISTIKLATKERLQLDCTISAQKRLGELNSIVSEAEAIEHDILIQVAPSIDQTNRTGFVRW